MLRSIEPVAPQTLCLRASARSVATVAHCGSRPVPHCLRRDWGSGPQRAMGRRATRSMARGQRGQWRAGDARLLEWGAMKRFVLRGLVIVAALMHLAAPIIAYAMARADALPGDICSAARTNTAAPAADGIPRPATIEHHCAHAPCCASGAVDAAAPPPPAVSLLPIASAGESVPAAVTIVAPTAPIIAAPPRGPPVLA